MKRFHVHVAVSNLEESIRFYTALFGVGPSIAKPDYAKWMLDDPRINFAISNRDRKPGVNHLGIQVDSTNELKQLKNQLESADHAVLEQTGASCCYAKSDKHWVLDPSGVAWETFHTLGSAPVYGEDTEETIKDGACCIPLAPSAKTKDAESKTEKESCCVSLGQVKKLFSGESRGACC